MIRRVKAFVLFAGLLGLMGSAQAVPSFSRQTGQGCAACHIGGFGPQLTPYGIRFKLGGYTDSDGKSGKVPLSAMLVASFDKTSKAQSAPPTDSSKTNNNAGLDEASIFLAGKLFENVGIFAQVTRDQNEKNTAWDQVDARFVKNISLAGKDSLIGITVNNNPSVQDPFNTLPAWGHPYTGSALAPSPGAASMLNGGLEQTVLGASAYAFIDNHYYAELGTYRTLSPSMLSNVGVGRDSDPGRLNSGTMYWRLAYMQDLKKQFYSVGLFGFNADISPDRSSPASNRFHDVGVDASYQWLGNREHIFTAGASWLHESQTKSAWVGSGDAASSNGHLNEAKLTASYHYRNAYGASLSRFDIRGSRDAVLYSSANGFANNSPNSAGYVWQVDWTPWGKEDSWMAPYANLRLGMQYVMYDKFNGAKTNYDGSGRDAKDNNTLYAFAWLAF